MAQFENPGLPKVLSVRVEHYPERPHPAPELGVPVIAAWDALLVEVQHYGRRGGGRSDEVVTLAFPIRGDASDGYRGIDPSDRAEIEQRVLESHREDLIAWRAGD